MWASIPGLLRLDMLCVAGRAVPVFSVRYVQCVRACLTSRLNSPLLTTAAVAMYTESGSHAYKQTRPDARPLSARYPVSILYKNIQTPT